MTPIHARIIKKIKPLADLGFGTWVNASEKEPIGTVLYVWADERCELVLGSEGLAYSEYSEAHSIPYSSIMGIRDHMTVQKLSEMSKAKNPYMRMQLDIITSTEKIALWLPYVVGCEVHPLMQRIADAATVNSALNFIHH